jgi:dolichol kinase/phosphoserine phosphatase
MGKQLGTVAFFKILFFGFLYESGVLPLKQALRHIFWIMRGSKVELLFQSLERIPLLPNVKLVFDELKMSGYRIVLISSGIPTILVERIASMVGADYAIGIQLGIKDKILTGEIWGDTTERYGKRVVLKEILQTEQCLTKDCVIIADDRNNASIFLKDAYKIAFNPDFILRIKADVVVTGKFVKILSAIKGEKHARSFPSKKDLTREAIHASGIFVPILAMLFGQYWVALGISSIIVAYSASELMRIHGRNMPIISAITRRAASQYELYEVALAPLYFAFGILLTLLIFPAPASSAAIAMFAFGDSSASIIGATISKKHLPFNRAKTLEGSLGGFIFAFLAGLLFVSPWIALIGAIIAMTIEYLPLPFNDNLIIPIGTGLALTLII